MEAGKKSDAIGEQLGRGERWKGSKNLTSWTASLPITLRWDTTVMAPESIFSECYHRAPSVVL